LICSTHKVLGGSVIHEFRSAGDITIGEASAVDGRASEIKHAGEAKVGRGGVS